MQPRPVSFLWAVAILLALFLHTLYKIHLGILPEMLWACHIASLGIAVSVFLRVPWLAGIGLLFHLAMGIPAYLIDAVATWTTSITSVLVHLLPAFVAWKVIAQSAYPTHNLRNTVIFVLASQVLSYLTTPPALNINLVFAPWGPLVSVFPNVWLYRLFNYGLACLFLLPVHFLLKRYFSRRS